MKQEGSILQVKTAQRSYSVALPALNGVLGPTVFAKLLTRNIMLREEEKQGLVADVGTGCGIIAISLALLGCTKVHAVDLTPESVISCNENAKANGVAHRITTMERSLDDFISGCDLSYDLIIANPPTFPSAEGFLKASAIDHSFFCTNGGHYFVDTLAAKASNVLEPDGRLLIVYPSYLNKRRICSIMAKAGLYVRTIARRTLDLERYSKIFTKYGYDYRKILDHVIEACRNESGNGLLWKCGHFYRFTLFIIEGSRKKPEDGY